MKRPRRATVLGFVGAVTGVAVLAGVLFVEHSPSPYGAGAKAKTVALSVTGTAPAGISAWLYDGVGQTVLALHSKPPFHSTFPNRFDDFYEIYARLRGAGSIVCSVRLGTVLAFGHTSGHRGICTATVSRDQGGFGDQGRLGYHPGSA